METRNFVPREDNEGGIGTVIKRWATGFINALTVNTIRIVTGAGANKVLTSDADGDASWVEAPSGIDWEVASSATNAVKGIGYLCDTKTTAAFTLTLPSTPTPGDMIGIADTATYFSINKLTIGANGNKIMGVASDMEVTTDNAAFTLVYSDATNGWRITNIVTPSSDYIGIGAAQYVTVSAKTGDGTLTAGELAGNHVITNTGAGGAVNLTLQAGTTGYAVRVIVTVADFLRITADGGDKFRYGATESLGGGYIRSNVIGTSFLLVWTGSNWNIMDLVGTLKYDE